MSPHYRFPDLTWGHVRTELGREIAQRRETYPRLVQKGRMDKRDADRELAVMEAIRSDADRFAKVDGTLELTPPATHEISWRDRCDAIRRELAWRSRVYPELARKGRPPSPEDAEIYNRRLACMLAIYEDGRDWIPSNGLQLPLGMAGDGRREHAEARVEWQSIAIHFFHRDGDMPMVEGILRMIALDDRHAADALRPSFAKQEEMAL